MLTWQGHCHAVNACLCPVPPAVAIEPQKMWSYRRFLLSAHTLPWLVAQITAADEAAAKSLLQLTLGQQLQQQWPARETDLQACLNKTVAQILSRCHGESRQYWDTS